ncbi:hypothetical protein PRIPAC_92922 [Pristionchus pacificus]|uniref:Uncharacterized protein n=1 Tax=Pristionchus pacificus TaxID=54126 RepID=A0A2A6CCZ5_PRIPA|nr:hypothetical protein PRIPAC_92922 [Pristionchus pacificus]|eukprot:PDM76072.1 hypothetical protein PRIPAC_39676 [Pristionchus pacificus]
MAIMKTTGVEADFHYFRSERNGFNHAVECEDRDAYLAVDKQIVDKITCRNRQWRAEGDNCDLTTTSVVCAKSCDSDVCSSGLSHPPPQYKDLHIYGPSNRHPCARATCKHGFVALAHNGSLLAEFDADTDFTCSGNGKWTTDDDVKYRHLMCKRKPLPCKYECDGAPWTSPLLNATSAAIRKGCSYSCPAGQALSTPTKKFAVTVSCATCTDDGFVVNDGQSVDEIGCSTCDVPDGTVATNKKVPRNKEAVSNGCVLTCKDDMRLRYGVSDKLVEAKYAPGNILYRQITPEGNNWITSNGTSLTSAHWVGCVKPTDLSESINYLNMYRTLVALLVTVAAVSSMPAACRMIQKLQDSIPSKYQHLLSNHQLDFYKTLSCEEIDTLCRVFAECASYEKGIAHLRDSHPALHKKVLEQALRQEQLGSEVQEHIDEFAQLSEDIRKRIIKAFPVFGEANALDILIEMNAK